MNEYKSINFLPRNIPLVVSELNEETAAKLLLRQALREANKFKSQHDYTLPAHLENFRIEYEVAEKKNFRIPPMSQLSPRLKKKLSLIPSPTAFEEMKIKKIEEYAAKYDKNKLYNSLARNNCNEDLQFDDSLVNMASGHVLIPNNIDVSSQIATNSINYFEAMEKAQKHQVEQDERLNKMFGSNFSTARNSSAALSSSNIQLPKLDSKDLQKSILNDYIIAKSKRNGRKKRNV